MGMAKGFLSMDKFLKFAPILSAIAGTLVLIFGNNVVQNYFSKRLISYGTSIRPSPTGMAEIEIKNISKVTCKAPNEIRFECANAKISSARLLDTNEYERHNIQINYDERNIKINSPRLAVGAYVKAEFTYSDMTGEYLRLKSPVVIGCDDGEYTLVDIKKEEINQASISLFPLIGIALLVIPIGVFVLKTLVP